MENEQEQQEELEAPENLEGIEGGETQEEGLDILKQTEGDGEMKFDFENIDKYL